MKVHRLWVNNSLRNYHYIVECEKTKQAVVFDPYDVGLIMQCVEQNDLQVTTIINTHEHSDHVQGNGELKKKTNAKIYAPNFDVFKDADVKVSEGDEIQVGEECLFYSYYTPGHTFSHFSYLLMDNHQPYLFSGDTIFNAGAGHVRSGSAQSLYDTFTQVLPVFSDDTLIYHGHDLFEGNLNFALSLEPGNEHTKEKLAQIKSQTPESRVVATMADEKTYNPFLRLDKKEIIDSLMSLGYLDKADSDEEKQVFVAMRKARDNW